MHPATVTARIHGVGVITKQDFAIFVAFKESMTLNLAREVIHGHRFGYQSRAGTAAYTYSY